MPTTSNPEKALEALEKLEAYHDGDTRFDLASIRQALNALKDYVGFASMSDEELKALVQDEPPETQSLDGTGAAVDAVSQNFSDLADAFRTATDASIMNTGDLVQEEKAPEPAPEEAPADPPVNGPKTRKK